MRVVVSACLLGRRCKYNGGSNENLALIERLRAEGHELVPVCPEVAGGLPIPRPRSEILEGAVVNEFGASVDEEFRTGAERELKRVLSDGPIDMAILQPRSPSCGVDEIYDGTFSGVLVPDDGVFAHLLREHGVSCVTPAQYME